MADAYLQSVLVFVGINMILASSLYPLMAAGQDSLGQAGFMAIGAYLAAGLTAGAGAPFLVAVAAGACAGALVALAVGFPALRLRGIYVALLTLGFGEIVRVFFLNFAATGGAGGLGGIPGRTTIPVVFGALALVLGCLYAVHRSRLRRTLQAIQEDELAARCLGVRAVRVKMACFAAGGAIAGLGGALYAHYALFIDPKAFGVQRSIEVFVFAVLGGAGAPWGPAAGAAALTLLPEILRPAQDWRPELYGLALLLTAIVRPRGLLAPGGRPGAGAPGMIPEAAPW